MPEHLSRPAIDEETLMKIKEQSKMKPLDKKMSLGAQKEHKLEAKRKQDIQIKIRRAEKNFRAFLNDIKKITEKADEEIVMPDL